MPCLALTSIALPGAAHLQTASTRTPKGGLCGKAASSRARHPFTATRATTESEDASSSPSTSASPMPPPKVRTTPPPGRSFPPPPPSAMQPDMKLQRVENLPEESVSGVAAVDRGGDVATSFSRAALLAGGDTLALLAFASVGRLRHAEGVTLGGALETALPFLIGWFVAAPLLGGFSKEAQGGDVGAATGAALKSWAVAVPLGVAIRSVMRGYLPDKSFIIVTLVATAVCLVGWRALAATKAPDTKGSSKKNRRGGPLEFLSLLGGLTKRW